MTRHIRTLSARFLIMGAVLLLAGCGQEEEEAIDEAARFRNVEEGAAFVGDEACFDCHEQEYWGFQEHGMAQSIYPMTGDGAVEEFPSEPIYDERHDLLYVAYREGDRFFQEEYRLDADGEKVHSLVREMELVVGSGTAARTYLTKENRHYYELPLTWYTQESRWAFSPGYETANQRFDRRIPDRCMTCHNSYPEPVEFAVGAFEEVPHGIGCERCHGPGSVHIEARLASPEPADSVDETIVNPAHLTLDRRLDVCQQCHLNTTVSILREGRTAYDYRPAQRLDDYLALFAAADDDEIDVISHADRMKSSDCFIETQTWENPMDCMTCHDPHEGFRDAGPEYFNATCRTCHSVSDLQEEMPTPETQEAHAVASNCFSCHMPKYEGTPHASFTDHWIRVVEETERGPRRPASGPDLAGGAADPRASDQELAQVDPLSSDPERGAAGTTAGRSDADQRPFSDVTRMRSADLEAYFEKDREDGQVYRGMAYVVYGRQQGDSTSMRRGVDVLASELQDHDEEFGEAHYLLGFAHLQLGEVEQAIPALERAVTINPGIPERLNTLAQAYEADRRSPSAIRRLYDRALAIQPALSEVRTNYGRFLEAQGSIGDAVEQYRMAVETEPWLETAHYNLGTALLRLGDDEAAEEALREAIHLNPDYADALSNLGLLLASRGDERGARSYFERAVRAEPENPVALGNLGAFHLNTGSLEEAVTLLSQAVEIDPQYVDGLVNLALAHFRRDEFASARTYAERALRLAPNNQLAQQILGAL